VIEMTAAATPLIAIGLEDYLTDGTHLFRVIDVLADRAALLEDAYDGQVAWQSLDELDSAAIKRILPSSSI
jgi:hypothetical protein